MTLISYKPIRVSLVLIGLLLFGTPPGISAETIHIAVASNFSRPMVELAKDFKAQTGHTLVVSPGSTGQHYAQIRQGAPFDVFLAADRHRPTLLEQAGIARPNSRNTYAIGKLVLWSPSTDLIDPEGQILRSTSFRRIAIANPRLAPYGIAAKSLLEKLGLWNSLSGRIVRGENIGQTYQFVSSGNAELGLVAFSQIDQPDITTTGSLWIPDPDLYPAIEQQAVQLTEQPASVEFLDYLKGESAREIIRSYGYEVP
ncbi:MAG: molybdate ABC transporter substrate-binding protein [bacterium]